jgi:hypothetical protein
MHSQKNIYNFGLSFASRAKKTLFNTTFFITELIHKNKKKSATKPKYVSTKNISRYFLST